MNDATEPALRFDPPGPGAWEAEAAHFARPITRFMQGPMLAGMPRGFQQSTARFGLLLSHIGPGMVNDFVYSQAVPFGAPPGAKGPPPRFILFLITRLLPSVRRRIATSKHAFENKIWREDLRRWDEEVKPAAIRAHLALQAVDPDQLDAAALERHVRDCAEHMEKMICQHHVFTVTCGAPVGDFVAHARRWTGRPVNELLQLLKGSSAISLGAGAPELAALGAALREDPEAQALCSTSQPPAEILAALRNREGRVGETARAYLDIVSYRSLGYDLSDCYALELPAVLLRTIRAAAEQPVRADDSEAVATRTQNIRDSVPAAHRASFDALLVEARLINRLRDERGVYSDGWASGLARRAVLAAGRKLVAMGAIADPELAVNATADEIVALLRGASEPTAAELGRRHKWRTTKSVADIPAFLGGRPGKPPPVEWLPPDARRAAEAMGAMMSGMFDEGEHTATSRRSVKGLAVSPGTYEGVARLVIDQDDFGRIEKGDVLVTRATSPYFNVVLPLLGGIVTDRGGQLCHAAIVAREYGIPGVVGTKEATVVIKDGERVRVDGTTGEVQVVG